MNISYILFIFLYFVHDGICWTTEDMELFDLVENTPQNFYDVLGVDPKASSSEIRKAYRKLSTQYHPDKNKQSNSEEVFRRIAAVADVLRNDERRKTYDLILKTGLPDWRAPIYYYRRVRNMGLTELIIFLFSLATLAQYLFAWSAYWERKYEIEEIVLSRIRKKAKNQRKKDKNAKIDEDAEVFVAVSSVPKPKCRDLFPIRLFYFIIYLITSAPSYAASCVDYFKQKEVESDSESEDEPQIETRVRVKRQAKPKIPDFSEISPYSNENNNQTVVSNGVQKSQDNSVKKKWSWDSLTEQQILELKKAIKKFPVGTLQRWEKVAAYLDCSVNEVVNMIKDMKNQQATSRTVLTSMQGVTGTEKENHGCELYAQKDAKPHENSNNLNDAYNKCANNRGSESKEIPAADSQASISSSEKIWKQEEQKSLEMALQKYPKDTPGRWDKIAEFVSTKTKEECIERFKLLAQQVKRRKAV